MKWHFWGQLTLAVLVLTVLLVAQAGPSHASMGTGRGFHGGSVQARGFQHAGFTHQRFHHAGFHHGFRHHPFFFHRPCCFGPRVIVGLGAGVPLVYPYTYPAFSTSVVESAPPVDVEPRQYWYYCQSAQMYYPYANECPGGWLQVVPQPTLPPR